MALEEENSGGGVPEWVVTFGDMMSLLLTFFIMLVSLSEIKEVEKYQALVESIRRQFGHDKSMASLAPGERKPRNSRFAKLAAQGRSRRLDTMSGGERVEATVGENPRVHSLRESERASPKNVVFFALGSAALDDAQKRQLDTVAGVLRGKPLKIEVRGHTSMRPLPSAADAADFQSLSYERAKRVMAYLVEQGIDARRFLLVAAAENEPLYLNDPELIPRNDRAEIYMLDETWDVRVGTPEEQEQRFRTDGG